MKHTISTFLCYLILGIFLMACANRAQLAAPAASRPAYASSFYFYSQGK